ncbi:MAG: class I SAM-dependent methyltransferase [Thaumarchaeota archaeon]|nr:class I SAM-dependent methyltransferase [Nitrososphaerota archaeon]
MILLRIANFLRLRRYGADFQLLNELLAPQKDDVILDVGAGTGAITNVIANFCDEVFACEPNENRLEFMKKKYPQIKALSARADQIPFPESYFTKIYAVASFHHFPDQDLALEEFSRILKPSGSLLIHDIEPKSATSRFERRASGVHFSSSGELIQKLEAHGFHQVRKMDAKRGFMILAKKAEEA